MTSKQPVYEPIKQDNKMLIILTLINIFFVNYVIKWKTKQTSLRHCRFIVINKNGDIFHLQIQTDKNVIFPAFYVIDCFFMSIVVGKKMERNT